jgi:hypothetical protein
MRKLIRKVMDVNERERLQFDTAFRSCLTELSRNVKSYLYL